MGGDGRLFEGDAVELPAPSGRRFMRYVEGSRRPLDVRHVAGYEPFVEFVDVLGASPAALAQNVLALVEFVRGRREALLQRPDLLRAAALFLGNALVLRAPAARWEVPFEYPIEVCQPGMGPSFPVERILPALLTADQAPLAQLSEALLEWDEAEVAEADARRRLTVRPDQRWAPAPFVIPEPSTPVTEGVLALISYLHRHYEVEVEDDLALAARLPHPPDAVERALRFTSTSGGAALTVALLPDGGVVVEVGLLLDLAFSRFEPDGWQQLSDAMLAAAAGGFREAYPLGRRRLAGHAVAMRDGGVTRSVGPVTELDPELLEAAATRLAALPEGWEPWRLRIT